MARQLQTQPRDPRPQIQHLSQHAQKAPQLPKWRATISGGGQGIVLARPPQAEVEPRPGQTQTAPGPVSAQFVCGVPSLRSPFRHSLKHRRCSNNIKLKPRRHTRLFKCMSLYNHSRRYKSSCPQALTGAPLYSTRLRVFGSECASVGILRSGVTDPTGSVYFISVPGITSARSPPTAMVQLEAGGQR